MNPKNRTAVDDAVRLLAQRGHGRVELSRKLAQRGHGSTDVERAFVRLDELGYLEAESELAERYARELSRKRGATPRAVRNKLKGRGFADADTEGAVGKVFRDWDARKAALGTLENETDPQKAARVLTRRGFSSDAIAWVVSRIRARPHPEEPLE